MDATAADSSRPVSAAVDDETDRLGGVRDRLGGVRDRFGDDSIGSGQSDGPERSGGPAGRSSEAATEGA